MLLGTHEAMLCFSMTANQFGQELARRQGLNTEPSGTKETYESESLR
jgi:hypothetical protein